MEETYLLNHPGVRKKILSGGTGPLPHFPPGAKLVFHFQTLLDDFERTVIDDSRLACRPAEIFVGKMFKMEVWETLLMSMRIGEVAEFWCDAVHTGLYPIVSKGMRLIAQGKDPLEGQRHMCGMGNMFHYHSTGYPELDELMRTPQPLLFIMELLQVGDPLSYHRESWMMEKDEKLEAVPTLHKQGNALVKQGHFREAASKYKEAVLLLRTVQSREMPGDGDYINLGRMIVPLELNYCQCLLELEDFYEVIEKSTELLEKHKDCVKGYYKRAKAHAAVWNEKEARKDFNMVAQLDITLASLIRRELNALSERMKEKYWEEKETYWNMLEKKENKNEEDEEEGDAEGNGKADAENHEEIKSLKVKKEKSSEESPTKCFESDEEEPKKSKDPASEKNCFREEKSSPAVTPNLEDEYQKKGWQRMLRAVMLLQSEGNFLIAEKRFQEASEKFKEAIDYVDFLQKKISQEEDTDSLEKVRLPLTLNLSQCLLELNDFQKVVELNNQLLQKHEGNAKAVYQRARAHASLCNNDEAQQDFDLVQKLDPKFKPIVRQELRRLADTMRTVHANQKKTYWDTTQEKWGPHGSRVKNVTKKKKVKFSQSVIKQSEAGERRGGGNDNEAKPLHAEGESESNTEREQKESAMGGGHKNTEREQKELAMGGGHKNTEREQKESAMGGGHKNTEREQKESAMGGGHKNTEREQKELASGAEGGGHINTEREQKESAMGGGHKNTEREQKELAMGGGHKNTEREQKELASGAEWGGHINTEREQKESASGSMGGGHINTEREQKESASGSMGGGHINTERVVVEDVSFASQDKESNSTATGLDKDNVKNKRSARDKRKKKVKCRWNPATGTSRTKPAKKDGSGKTGREATPPE